MKGIKYFRCLKALCLKNNKSIIGFMFNLDFYVTSICFVRREYKRRYFPVFCTSDQPNRRGKEVTTDSKKQLNCVLFRWMYSSSFIVFGFQLKLVREREREYFGMNFIYSGDIDIKLYEIICESSFRGYSVYWTLDILFKWNYERLHKFKCLLVHFWKCHH